MWPCYLGLVNLFTQWVKAKKHYSTINTLIKQNFLLFPDSCFWIMESFWASLKSSMAMMVFTAT